MLEVNLKTTTLINAHRALGARFAPFSGWLMPIQYKGIIAEHNWTRRSCSLFDICHMGEFIISGQADKSNLEKIITVNLDKMPDNSCRYGFMLQEDGGIIDDVLIYKLKKDQWMLVVNAANTDTDEAHLMNHLSKDCGLENISGRLGKLDLQGPLSCNILKKIVGEDISRLGYYRFGYFSVLGEENIISRTGYTGELGYELYLSNENVEELWRALLKDERVRPAGLGARDTLRLEMGLPLYGQDINRGTTPEQAGFKRFVDYNRGFIGKEALIEKRKNGLKRKLSCFIADSRRAPRQGYKIYSAGRSTKRKEVGIVTSGSFSPSLSRGIGMGYIESAYNSLGTQITIKQGNVEIKARIVDRPFYKQGSVRRQ